MSAWVGVAPLIGAGSLDGFAIGALASGACFLAITALRRGRKRYGLALSDGRGPKEGWLCEHVMAAEAFPAYAERLAQPYIPDRLESEGEDNRADAAGPDDRLDGANHDGRDDPASQEDDGLDWMSPASQAGAVGHERGWTFLASGDGRAAGSHRSRHRRLSDPIPGSASRKRRSFGGRGAPREAASHDDLLPAGTSRHAAFPDGALHGGALHGGALRGGALRGGAHRPPELVFPDDTFETSRRSDVRRLPRHAAPATGLSSRLSARMSSVMSSLTATRLLTGGAHG
jgi:hypothetical protein